MSSYKRLKKYLNPAINGKFANALLKAVAKGDDITDFNVMALKDNLFIATAQKRYLDKLLAGIGFTRPTGVGIDDKSVREIAVAVTNQKVVTNIFLLSLELFYGEDATKANTTSLLAEPFNLSDGQDLFIKQDGFDQPLRVEFKAERFDNIASAKAIEVASVISQEAIKNGYTLYATTYLDAATNLNYVRIFSGTRGSKSSIQIVGGTAQNALRFPDLRPTTQAAGTQFTVSYSGEVIRYTWTGGTDPGLAFVQKGDYVIISSPPFPQEHAGSFEVVDVLADGVGVGYFEIVNPLVQTTGTYVLSSPSQLRFYHPKRNSVFDLIRKALVFEVNPYEVVVFMPATSQIVKRILRGSWHLHIDSANSDYPNGYIFNPKSGISISSITTTLNQDILAGRIYSVIDCANTSQFPNEMGYLVFNYGKENQEGPIRYLSKPSNSTLLLDSSYIFKNNHSIGSDITLIRRIQPYQPKNDGSDYAAYLTGTTKGRVEAEKLIKAITAAGIFLNIIIVYPEGPGLNNIEDVYAPDP